MIFKDIIIVVVLVGLALGILIYVGKQKKSGNKCIGCPHGGQCSGNCSDDKN